MYFSFNLSKYCKLIIIFFILIAGCFLSTNKALSNKQTPFNKSLIFPENNFSSIFGNYLSSLAAKNNFDFNLASHYALEALKEDINSIDLLKHTFTILLYSGQIEKASEISSRLELFNVSDEMFNIWPAILLELKHNDLSTAHELTENLNLESYERFFSHVLTSWYYASQNQQAKSLTHINIIIDDISLYPSISLIQVEIQKLLILFYLRNYNEAKILVEKIRNRSKKIPTKYVLVIAQVMSFLGEKKGAIKLLTEYLPYDYDLDLAILSLDKKNALTPIQALSISLEDTGSIFAKSNGWFKAIPILRMAIYLDNNNFNSKLLMSSILQSMKRYEEALALLDENKNYSFYNPIISIEKSYIEEELGNDERVVSILTDLSKHSNFNELAMLKLSNYYIRKKQFIDALKICDELLLNKASENEIYYYRALSLVSIKDWNKALDALDILLKKIPDNATVMNFVGYTFVDRNIRLEEGLNLIKKAIQIDPNNGYFLDSLGWAYFRMGEYNKAVNYIEKSVELEPMEPEITDHLGDVYYKLKRNREAVVQWKRALSLNPNDEYKDKIRKKILKNETN